MDVKLKTYNLYDLNKSLGKNDFNCIWKQHVHYL